MRWNCDVDMSIGIRMGAWKSTHLRQLASATPITKSVAFNRFTLAQTQSYTTGSCCSQVLVSCLVSDTVISVVNGVLSPLSGAVPSFCFVIQYALGRFEFD